jgi:hypothetical protein
MDTKVLKIETILWKLFYAVSYYQLDTVRELITSLQKIKNNPCALKAWALKAKRIIGGIV